MTEPTTPLAADPELLPTGDEGQLLHSFLDYYRTILLRKAEGLSEEQARMTLGSSDITLIGLVRHMAEVEQSWFRRRFAGHDVPFLFDYTDDPDTDFHPAPDDTLDEALAVLRREIDFARGATAGHAMDEPATFAPPTQRIPGWNPSLRWIMIHMIEEYARHCGHADLLRQAADGAIGD